ncbi:CD209 antigen-like protein D [Pogona vitticeps]
MYDDTEASSKGEDLCGTSRPLPPKPTEKTENVEDEYENYSEESDYDKIELPYEREEPKEVLEPPNSGRKFVTAESTFIAAHWKICRKKTHTLALLVLVAVYLLIGIILLSQNAAMSSELRKLNFSFIQESCKNSTVSLIIKELRSAFLTEFKTLQKHIDEKNEASDRKVEEKISQLELKFHLQQNVRNACWRPDSLSWQEFHGSCYYFSETAEKWTDAKKLCALSNSHLIIINSRKEQDFVIGNIKSVSMWLGLNDVHTEGTWHWIDGSIPTQTYWRVGEPNNDGDEDCAALYNNGKWNDISCDVQVHYGCEREVCVNN